MGKPLTIFHPEGLPHESNTIEQIETCLEHPSAVAGVLCADAHLGYEMPIGGVVAYQDAISPTGVGFDIGCGNMAVRTNLRLKDVIGADEGCPPNMIPTLKPEEFNAKIKPIMREIQKKVELPTSPPSVYKDLPSVLAAHSNIEVVEWLRPIGVVMAGEDTYDPFKD